MVSMKEIHQLVYRLNTNGDPQVNQILVIEGSTSKDKEEKAKAF